jgi:hypothetical protein
VYVVDDTTVSCGCRVLPVTTVLVASIPVFVTYGCIFHYYFCRITSIFIYWSADFVCYDRMVRTCESSVHGYFFVIYLLRVRRSSVALNEIVSCFFFKTFWVRFGLCPQWST